MYFNSKGFTLIEVLLAVFVVSIGLMAVAGMQSTAITGNRFANEGTIAVQLAEEMIDRIRVNYNNDPDIYDGIDTSGACGGSDPALGDCTQWKARLEDVSMTGLQGAVGTVQIQCCDTPIDHTATVTVTVTWGTVITRSVELETIVELWLT